MQYIDENLDEELTLEMVSKVAHYSPFHFHRIFKATINETLNAYIHRKRIEKSAAVLIRKKEVTVSQLSLEYGFTSNSSFTRSFKKFYGINPSKFRKLSPGRYSKVSRTESKNGQEKAIFEDYVYDINHHKNYIEMNADIEIKELPLLNLAFITHIGEKGLGNAFDKLLKWGGSKGLLNDPDFKMTTIYYDSFKITDPDKVRMSACLILNTPIEPDDEVGITIIQKGKHIVGSFEIKPEEFGRVWSSLFVWMNENGHKKNEENPFEIYHNNFNEHPERKCIVDMCIPIK